MLDIKTKKNRPLITVNPPFNKIIQHGNMLLNTETGELAKPYSGIESEEEFMRCRKFILGYEEYYYEAPESFK